MNNDSILKGKKGQIEAIFSLTKEEGTPILHIQLTNTQLCARYHLRISQDFIQEQDQIFTLNFETVTELYQHLVSEFDRLIFAEGAILFDLEVTIKKKLERKQYRLQGLKEKITETEQLQLQINFIRIKMRQDSEMKDERIAELERKQKIFEEEKYKLMQSLRQQMIERIHKANDTEKAQLQLTKIRDDIERNQENIKIIKRETLSLIEDGKNDCLVKMQQIKRETERYGQGLSIINRYVEEHEQMIKEILKLNNNVELSINKKESKKEEQKQYISIAKYLRAHTQNPHRANFIVKQELKSFAISKLGEDGKWMSYFGALQLDKRRKYSFLIKLIKTQKKAVMFGISTKNSFGKSNAYSCKQNFSYHAKSGKVWQMGIQREGGSSVAEGSVVTLNVNLIDFKIEWFIDNKRQASTNIGILLRGSSFYFVIQMAHAGDQVQVLI